MTKRSSETGHDQPVPKRSRIDLSALDVESEDEGDWKMETFLQYQAQKKLAQQAEVELRTQAEAEVDLRTHAEAEVEPRTQAEAEVDLRTQAEAEVELRTLQKVREPAATQALAGPRIPLRRVCTKLNEVAKWVEQLKGLGHDEPLVTSGGWQQNQHGRWVPKFHVWPSFDSFHNRYLQDVVRLDAPQKPWSGECEYVHRVHHGHRNDQREAILRSRQVCGLA